MSARAEATAETRKSIVEAAKELHAERGVQATSFEEIAERAGVSLATVYRHFPSLKELVPACAQSVFDLIRPPTLEEASRKFATIADPSERLALLLRRTVHCYDLGEGWLHAAYRERDFIPELDAALRIIQDSLRVLIQAAVARKLRKSDEAALFVLCDFPFYKSLQSAGLERRAAERTLLELALEVERKGRKS
jgi:AcrR family transcriptional regulator